MQDDKLPEWFKDMIEEEEKSNPERWADENDYLVFSLGCALILFSVLIFTDNLKIPDPLFLGVAIFSIYFFVASSLQKKTSFKLVLIGLTFPITVNLTLYILKMDYDISKINNALSLIALGISLIYLPRQKTYERARLEKNKLKNKIIEDKILIIEDQREIISDLKEELVKLKSKSYKKRGANVVPPLPTKEELTKESIE